MDYIYSQLQGTTFHLYQHNVCLFLNNIYNVSFTIINNTPEKYDSYSSLSDYLTKFINAEEIISAKTLKTGLMCNGVNLSQTSQLILYNSNDNKENIINIPYIYSTICWGTFNNKNAIQLIDKTNDVITSIDETNIDTVYTDTVYKIF